MTVVSLKELKEKLPAGKRLMGVDCSAKAWGLALSDPGLSIATPLKTIMRGKFRADVEKLGAVCREYDVAGFVIGLPLNMDGSSGPRVDSVRHFAFNLMQEKSVLGFDPLIAFQDERLSTFGAEQDLIDDLDMSRTKREKRIDSHAALNILQAALKTMENQ